MLETDPTTTAKPRARQPAEVPVDPDLPLGASDLRDKIPVLGLTEYWYPAVKDSKIGWKKPVFIKMLGEDLCLFRGKSGKVAALANACPHRGAMLAHGNCEFP